MLRFLRRCGLLILIVFVFGFSTAAAAEMTAPLKKMILSDGDSIVFLGDSITHQCLYTQYVEDFFYTRFPKMRLKIHNSGVGGAQAWDALQRFDRDVAAYKPKYVTVLLGMNDGRYQPYNEAIFRKYHKDMTEVITRIRKIGATPILMTPTMYDSRAARMRGGRRAPAGGRLELYNSVLSYYGTWLREVAVENGYGFVDMYGPLNNLTLQQRKTNPKFTLIPDSVHPAASGQLVMAYAIIEDMGLRGPVSNIRVLSAGGKTPKAQVRGGKITGLVRTKDGVSFTFLAKSLPWVLPQDADVGVKILKLGHRASREALEIHGLAPGRYELTIDGKHVGIYSHTALSRHIELQSNAKTPQYQQAAKVAELNKRRNAGPVRSLRNEWRNFQGYARAAAQLKKTPGNEGLAKRVVVMKERLKGIEERIKKHEAAAKVIEDQIFKVNQPQPRKYELKRVRMSKVSATVTFQGKPLAGATVIFHAVSDGYVASGVTDKDAIVVLKTGRISGIKPGKYRVTISSVIKTPGGKNRPGPASAKSRLPLQYADRKTTPLTVEVKPGDNVFQFNLSN